MKAKANSAITPAAGRTRGAFLLTTFGMLWLLSALVPDSVSHPLRLIVAIVVCGLLMALAHTSSQMFARPADSTPLSDSVVLSRLRFRTINRAQWGALMLCDSVLAATGHFTLIEPVSVAIIGVHFFAVAVLFEMPLYWMTGAILLVLSGLAIWLPSTIDAGHLAIGVGLTLWASASYLLSGTKLKALAQIDFWSRVPAAVKKLYVIAVLWVAFTGVRVVWHALAEHSNQFNGNDLAEEMKGYIDFPVIGSLLIAALFLYAIGSNQMHRADKTIVQRNFSEFLFLIVEEAGTILFNLGSLLAAIAFFAADWNYAFYAIASYSLGILLFPADNKAHAKQRATNGEW